MGNQSSSLIAQRRGRLHISRCLYLLRLENYVLLIPCCQDHYRLPPSPDSKDPQSCINEKLKVIKAHLERAVDQSLHPEQLFISFASAAFRFEEPTLTPKV